MTLKYDDNERIYNIDYVENEISENEKLSTEPEDIKKCSAAGVTPKCYEDTNIEIKLWRQNEVSCFLRHEDGSVTCPMGQPYPNIDSMQILFAIV